MIVGALGFKLSLVPFHLWTSDVYQGAPAPISALIATLSKGAIFAVLLRYFVVSHAFDFAPLFIIVSLIAHRLDPGRQLLGIAAKQYKANTRLLIDRPLGLSAGGFCGRKSNRQPHNH